MLFYKYRLDCLWCEIGEENLIVLPQPPTTADTSIVVASLEQNFRFAIELILFFTCIQVLGLSQLGLIIEPSLHLRPPIIPPESHGSWIRAKSMLSASSFLHISAEAALLWCKLIFTNLIISIGVGVPELFLVLLEVPDPAPVAPSLVLAVCSGRFLLPASVLAWSEAFLFSRSSLLLAAPESFFCSRCSLLVVEATQGKLILTPSCPSHYRFLSSGEFLLCFFSGYHFGSTSAGEVWNHLGTELRICREG